MIDVPPSTESSARPDLDRALTELIEAGEALPGIVILRLEGVDRLHASLGRPSAESVLDLAHDRIVRAVRADDVVRTAPGHRVVVVGAGVDASSVESLATRLVELTMRPFLVAGHQVHVQARAGVVTSLDGADDGDDLLRHAELALEAAPVAGTRTFTDEMIRASTDDLAIETDLRRALARRELSVAYQPQIDVASSRVRGFEALCRWTTADGRSIPPGRFIPVAERIGLIDRIGMTVLRQACRDAVGWAPELSVAVNVSAVQLRRTDFVDDVATILAEFGLAPDRLELEITESVLMDDTDAVLSQLWRIHDMGIGIAMDDFGTGYSSLSYLNLFPFSTLKIDRSFVQSSGDERSQNLVRAILALGSGLDMTTVAEGVETEEQFSALEREGCLEVQGFLFAKPMPADQVADYLDRAGSTLR